MAEKTEVVEKKSSSKPSWVKMKKGELEKLILDLAKEGKTPAQIGLVLRDKFGVPKAKLLGVRICEVLEKNEIEYSDDQKIVEGHLANLKRHLSKNKHDYPASRALSKKLWARNRLEKQKA